MNKILIGISLTLIAGTAAVGVTRAYFSDSENSAGNTIAAGTLDLKIAGGDSAVTLFNLSNKAPGDTGSAKATLNNSGSLGGELDVTMGTVDDDACNPDGTNDGTEYCDTNANLGSNAQMAPYLDVDQSGSWSSGDIGLKSDATKYANPTSLDYATINSYSGKSWNDVYGGLMAAAASDDFTVNWQIPTATGNSIQGDDVGFAVTFTLEQAGVD
jgi:predicted ribosomally synthesized peptide with SipW-like signal peptide